MEELLKKQHCMIHTVQFSLGKLRCTNVLEKLIFHEVNSVFAKSSNIECAKKLTNAGSLLLAYAWTASKLLAYAWTASKFWSNVCMSIDSSASCTSIHWKFGIENDCTKRSCSFSILSLSNLTDLYAVVFFRNSLSQLGISESDSYVWEPNEQVGD
jgi:hypothetical protein